MLIIGNYRFWRTYAVQKPANGSFRLNDQPGRQIEDCSSVREVF